MTQSLRWPTFIALSSISLLIAVLIFLSSTMATVAVPEPGGTYVEGIPGQPGNLNPLFLQNRTDADIAALVFEPLTRVDVDGTITTGLATHWEISPDGLVYTLHLREDVYWHDGEPFTAEDVAYTIGVIQDATYTSTPPVSEVWRTVRVEVVNSYTIRFTLPQPYAPFLSYTTLIPVPEHILSEWTVAEMPNSPFSRTPIGTGRWQVSEVTANDITLTPAIDYFGTPPMLDRVVLRFYPTASSIVQAYKRGEVTGIGQVMPQNVADVLRDPRLQLQSATRSGLTLIALNFKSPIFESEAVRQALLLGLNRPALIAQVLEGQAIPAASFVLPSHWAYNPGIKQYPHDPNGARDLLTQAGWVDNDGDGLREKDGQPFQFVLLTNEEDSRLVALTEAIARQWVDLGIRAEVQAINFADLSSVYLHTRTFDAVVMSLAQLPIDPDPYPLFHSTQVEGEGGNLSGFDSETADRLLVEGRRVPGREQRREIYFDFQDIFAEELPVLPLFHPIYNYAVDIRVSNVKIGPLRDPSDRFLTIPNWYIRTKRIIQSASQPTATPQVPPS